jgi:hypothetical protein
MTPGQVERYVSHVRAGKSLAQIAAQENVSRQAISKALRKAGYRFRDLTPPRLRPQAGSTARRCASCGREIRTGGILPPDGMSFCSAPECRKAARRWWYKSRPGYRTQHDLSRRQYEWRKRHAGELPAERALPAHPQSCSVCGAPLRRSYPWIPVRYCVLPECQREAKRVKRERLSREAPIPGLPSPAVDAPSGGGAGDS